MCFPSCQLPDGNSRRFRLRNLRFTEHDRPRAGVQWLRSERKHDLNPSKLQWGNRFPWTGLSKGKRSPSVSTELGGDQQTSSTRFGRRTKQAAIIKSASKSTRYVKTEYGLPGHHQQSATKVSYSAKNASSGELRSTFEDVTAWILT